MIYHDTAYLLGNTKNTTNSIKLKQAIFLGIGF